MALNSDVTLSYSVAGDGPETLLMLHGSNQSSSTFAAQFQSSALKKYKLIALDLPHHGHSSSPAHASMLHFTTTVAEFIKQTMTTPPLIVGLSLGGHITLGLMASGIPMAGAVLIATPPAAKPINMAEMFRLDGPMGLLYKNEMSATEKQTLAKALYAQQWNTEQELKDIDLVAPFYRTHFPTSLMAGEHIDEQEFISRANCKTLIVTAEYDHFVNNAHIVRHLPPGAVYKNYQAGHNLHQEAASQFNTDLATFAAEVFQRRG